MADLTEAQRKRVSEVESALDYNWDNRDQALHDLRRALDATDHRTERLAQWAETWGESAMREIMR